MKTLTIIAAIVLAFLGFFAGYQLGYDKFSQFFAPETEETSVMTETQSISSLSCLPEDMRPQIYR
ncbi:MAG: hypothetical protein GX221_05585 [Candidatus Riflebacteria bacterium]|nr:hypothetical protein [Candidatus Riflebacteria bacterium]